MHLMRLAVTGASAYFPATATPSNPYSEGSGHYAGYVWAEENEPTICSGNSGSFIERCETYMSQVYAHEECIEGRR